MKIQLIRIHKDGKQQPIRIFSHSEEIIIQRTRVKVIDGSTDKINAMYVLEGLGPTGWMTIETTGNQELFAYIYVGDEIASDFYFHDFYTYLHPFSWITLVQTYEELNFN